MVVMTMVTSLCWGHPFRVLRRNGTWGTSIMTQAAIDDCTQLYRCNLTGRILPSPIGWKQNKPIEDQWHHKTYRETHYVRSAYCDVSHISPYSFDIPRSIINFTRLVIKFLTVSWFHNTAPRYLEVFFP